MSRRRRPSKTESAATNDQPSAGANASATSTEARLARSAETQAAQAAVASRRVILVVILVVFAIFEISIVLIFRSGEEIHWKKELTQIDSLYEEGRYANAAERMTQFGKDWPGATKTLDWNRKMGLYHGLASDWKTAAAFYQRAAAIDPKAPGVNALAGEALWNAGEKNKATPYFEKEIAEIPRALGDHDRANYYLGIAAREKADYMDAFRHFQSISDRTEWKEQLDSIYAEIETELVKPALEKARDTPLDQIPGSKS